MSFRPSAQPTRTPVIGYQPTISADSTFGHHVALVGNLYEPNDGALHRVNIPMTKDDLHAEISQILDTMALISRKQRNISKYLSEGYMCKSYLEPWDTGNAELESVCGTSKGLLALLIYNPGKDAVRPKQPERTFKGGERQWRSDGGSEWFVVEDVYKRKRSKFRVFGAAYLFYYSVRVRSQELEGGRKKLKTLELDFTPELMKTRQMHVAHDKQVLSMFVWIPCDRPRVECHSAWLQDAPIIVLSWQQLSLAKNAGDLESFMATSPVSRIGVPMSWFALDDIGHRWSHDDRGESFHDVPATISFPDFSGTSPADDDGGSASPKSDASEMGGRGPHSEPVLHT